MEKQLSFRGHLKVANKVASNTISVHRFVSNPTKEVTLLTEKKLESLIESALNRGGLTDFPTFEAAISGAVNSEIEIEIEKTRAKFDAMPMKDSDRADIEAAMVLYEKAERMQHANVVRFQQGKIYAKLKELWEKQVKAEKAAEKAESKKQSEAVEA